MRLRAAGSSFLVLGWGDCLGLFSFPGSPRRHRDTEKAEEKELGLECSGFAGCWLTTVRERARESGVETPYSKGERGWLVMHSGAASLRLPGRRASSASDADCARGEWATEGAVLMESGVETPHSRGGERGVAGGGQGAPAREGNGGDFLAWCSGAEASAE